LAETLTLGALAYAAGLAVRPQRSEESDAQVRARGMSTGDFSKMLADGVSPLVQRVYEAKSEHLKFCSILPVKRLNTPMPIPTIDSDLELEEMASNAQMRQSAAFATVGAKTCELLEFAKVVFVSRELIINDDRGFLGSIFSALGSSASRVESRLVTKALESPQALDDNAAFFSINAGNVLADPGLTELTLAAAMGQLRNQKTVAGNRADLKMHHLIVSSELEVPARKLVFSLGLPGVEITVLANLPTGRWYALADPQIQPVIGVLRLAGSKSPVLVEQGRKDFDIDGTPVAVSAYLGATLLSRVGIVRGG